MEVTLISDDQMLELLESVWSSMLYVPVQAVARQGNFPAQTQLTASVQIAGDFRGTVLLHMTEAFAQFAAATMLASEQAGRTDADRHDAAAELCNIIGGSIKSLLPGRNTLSLPIIVHGEDFLLRVPNTHVMATLDVESMGEPLRVRILTQSDYSGGTTASQRHESAGSSAAGATT